MNAVGIDVSKGKSMVAALRPMGEVALLPQEFLHTEVGLEQMAYAIIALGEDTRVVMEATGRYHEPVAAALHEYGIYVSVLNPLFIKQSGGGSIRKVKTDKADAMKIAKYGLDNWVDLREYTPMDTVRQQLKLCSRQYNLYMKTVVSLQNNLISLTDKTFPGVNELFSSPERADGHQKWVDFVMTFWHCDCICRVSEKAFTERYQKWCKRKGYHFSTEKALDLYAGSCGHFTTLPKNDNTKLLITTAAQQLLAGKMTLAALEATLRLYLDPEDALRRIPTLRMLTEDAETVRERAEALMVALAERVTLEQAHLEIVEETGRAGGGSLPMCDIPTFCVRMRFEAGNAQGCEEHLQRNRDVPVIGRIKRECVLFDARTITEEDIPEIVSAVASYFAAIEGREES